MGSDEGGGCYLKSGGSTPPRGGLYNILRCGRAPYSLVFLWREELRGYLEVGVSFSNHNDMHKVKRHASSYLRRLLYGT